MKPVFRFTFGPCTPVGTEIFIESVYRAIALFGEDAFDWFICHNGINKQQLSYLRNKFSNFQIEFYEQKWSLCPIDDVPRLPLNQKGEFEPNGYQCGGTLWKICPPRLRPDAHEIIMDNDIVLLKKIDVIEEWLSYEDHTLVLEEPVKFYGRFEPFLPPDPPFFNSGLMGLPPGLDFGSAIRRRWEEAGKPTFLSCADEQGMLVSVLIDFPALRIDKQIVKEVLHDDLSTGITGKEYAIHFTQANRSYRHEFWEKYKKYYGTMK